MTATSRVLQANLYRRERWRNGAGWTREIHAEPAPARDATPVDAPGWAWRMSIAEITGDARFSAFPGVDRELVLLAGNGLRLRFDDADAIELEPPYGQHRFAGEAGVTGELIDGPTLDFNLMWRRDLVAAELWRRPVVGAMVIFTDPGSCWAIHMLAGQARFADGSGLPDLAMGDTALLQAGDQRLRHVIDGGGEALLIRVAPVDTPGGLSAG